MRNEESVPIDRFLFIGFPRKKKFTRLEDINKVDSDKTCQTEKRQV